MSLTVVEREPLPDHLQKTLSFCLSVQIKMQNSQLHLQSLDAAMLPTRAVTDLSSEPVSQLNVVLRDLPWSVHSNKTLTKTLHV